MKHYIIINKPSSQYYSRDMDNSKNNYYIRLIMFGIIFFPRKIQKVIHYSD